MKRDGNDLLALPGPFKILCVWFIVSSKALWFIPQLFLKHGLHTRHILAPEDTVGNDRQEMAFTRKDWGEWGRKYQSLISNSWDLNGIQHVPQMLNKICEYQGIQLKQKAFRGQVNLNFVYGITIEKTYVYAAYILQIYKYTPQIYVHIYHTF